MLKKIPGSVSIITGIFFNMNFLRSELERLSDDAVALAAAFACDKLDIKLISTVSVMLELKIHQVMH